MWIVCSERLQRKMVDAGMKEESGYDYGSSPPLLTNPILILKLTLPSFVPTNNEILT